MKTKRQVAEKQIELQERIQASGINVVSCGNCGSVMFHEISDESDIQCIDCDMLMAQCDCPDFWYKGLEGNYSNEPIYNGITFDDVVNVATDLKMNPSISDIREVLKYYESEETQCYDMNWTEIVENLLYNCVAPSNYIK